MWNLKCNNGVSLYEQTHPLNTPIPISELKDDPQIQDVLKKIQSGEITLGTGDDNIPPWTKEDIARLDKALVAHHGKRQAKKDQQEKE